MFLAAHFVQEPKYSQGKVVAANYITLPIKRS